MRIAAALCCLAAGPALADASEGRVQIMCSYQLDAVGYGGWLGALTGEDGTTRAIFMANAAAGPDPARGRTVLFLSDPAPEEAICEMRLCPAGAPECGAAIGRTLDPYGPEGGPIRVWGVTEIPDLKDYTP